MADGILTMHSAGHVVSLDEVNAVTAPEPTATWYPLRHGFVLDKVKQVLGEAGFGIRKEGYGLSHENARFFGVLDLEANLAEGVTLSVGVRNSTDQTFPIGFCAGSRVFVCSNLSFTSDLLVRKKHTRHGSDRFIEAIGLAMKQLHQFQVEESHRIRYMRETPVNNEQAESMMLRAFEKGIVNSIALPNVIKEWREPHFEEFRPRNKWSLMNAFTSVLGKRAETNPHAYAAQTMRLTSHLTSDIPKLDFATAV